MLYNSKNLNDNLAFILNHKIKKRRKTIRCLFPRSGCRQATMPTNKQRIVHAHERELPTTCPRWRIIWRHSNVGEQELKAQIQYSISTNGNAFPLLMFLF